MSREKQYEIKINNFISNTPLDNEMDYIPIISDEDEESQINIKIPEVLPILPLRNSVLFPGILIPITVGRQKSMKLIREAYNSNRFIGTIAQKDANIEEPAFGDLYKVGTVAQILKVLEMPDGSTSVIIQGKKRFATQELISAKPYFSARITVLQ